MSGKGSDLSFLNKLPVVLDFGFFELVDGARLIDEHDAMID